MHGLLLQPRLLARGHHSIREEWGIKAEAFCFLFAGKFLAKKRPFDLIEATRRLQHAIKGKKMHLLWVGTGELGDKLRQACHTCFDAERGERVNASNRGNGPNASFVGFLNQSEIQSSLCRSRLSCSSERCNGDLGPRRQRGDGERPTVHCERRMRLRGGSR